MINIAELRLNDMRVISLGSHPAIIQSMLDYDFLVKKQQPSVVAIIANGRKQERYFWGETEVIVPVYPNLGLLSQAQRNNCTAVFNVQSARRVLSSTIQALELLPNIKVLTIFAEQTPEAHSLQLVSLAEEKDVMLIGPSSVGLLVPGSFKLGAIGGTQHQQLSEAGIFDEGDTAIVSTSGGMVNELIHTVTQVGLGVSFAVAVGGDRFPLTTPAEAMLMAEADTLSKRIVFFGELGGTDEYDIAKLIDSKQITKEVIVYIAGTVAELFDTPPQFGHAKAMANNHDESASAKKNILKSSGAIVCETFSEVSTTLQKCIASARISTTSTIGFRQQSMIMSHISGDKDSKVNLLGKELLETVESNTIASLVLSLLLGKQVVSDKAVQFVDYVFRLLMDHGPYVSGALNTIVAARAGKDLVSSLAAGLLTVGPRFGGAINAAGGNWLDGVAGGTTARQFVESFANKGGIVPGIGHKKYHTNLPDPRVSALIHFSGNTNGDRYLKFALSVEEVTTAKKGTLILNVDGVIAAIMLDILQSELSYDEQQLRELVEIEFFNALFVLSRSVGFTAHYLDQRRHDEGLLRLLDDDVRYVG